MGYAWEESALNADTLNVDVLNVNALPGFF